MNFAEIDKYIQTVEMVKNEAVSHKHYLLFASK